MANESEETSRMEERLAEVLSVWPLYRELKFVGPENVAVCYLPLIIALYCDNCKNIQLRERRGRRTRRVSGAGIPRDVPETDFGVNSATYVCRNCTSRNAIFHYRWLREKDSNNYTLLKDGQFPPPDERIDRELEARLQGEDLEFYRKALRLRNHALGIAALTYLRRVVEDRMNELLDVISEEAKHTSFADEELKKIEEVKQSWRFRDKLEYAARIIPPHLRPDGHNPLDLLHGLASEGIHSKSEDECIEIFDKSRKAFEYFFKKLKLEQEEREAFRRSVIQLTTKSDSSF